MKTKRKVILAGGSGFLGCALTEQLTNAGYEVVILSRGTGESKGTARTVFWDGMTEGVWCDELEGAEALINLAGRSVDCRYTEENRRLILDSRVNSTRVLALAIKHCAIPPKVWVNAASATIYADTRGDLPANTETDGVIGEGFSVGVCREWEAEFNRCTLPQTKKVCLRVAITLGAEGGAMVPLMNLARFGLGGRQGDGEQWVSWLHVDDFCGIVLEVIEGRLKGEIYNCAAPEPLKNADFIRKLRRAVGGLASFLGIPASKFILKIGALVIGTETELILKSRKVAPLNLLQDGYTFKYPNLDNALEVIAVGRKR